MNAKARITVVSILAVLLSFAPNFKSYADPTIANNISSSKDTQAGVSSAGGSSLSGSCTTKTGYCNGFFHCNIFGEMELDVAAYGAKVGDVYWTEGNAMCNPKYNYNFPGVLTTHLDLAPCIKYFDVYRFYGTPTDPTESVYNSKVYLPQQCQNIRVGTSTTANFNLRLFTTNAWDDVTNQPSVGTPWNFYSKTISYDEFNKNSGSYKVTASEQCPTGIISSTNYNSSCRLTTGESSYLTNVSKKSCQNVQVNNSISFNSALNDKTKIMRNNQSTTLGDAVRDIIYSTLNSVQMKTLQKNTRNSQSWLELGRDYGSPQDIRNVDPNFNCSNVLQFIPVTKDKNISPDKAQRVVGTCIVGVGDFVHSFYTSRSKTSLGFAHYGPTIAKPTSAKVGTLAADRYLQTSLLGTEDATPDGYKSGTANYRAKYLAALESTIKSKEIYPKLSEAIFGQEAKTWVQYFNGTSTPDSRAYKLTVDNDAKFTSFSENVKCYSQELKPELISLNLCPDGITPMPDNGVCTCPDGSAIPANGVCPVCPDGSAIPANGACPSEVPTANCDSPCITVNLNMPAKFVTGGSLRPQTVKATANYKLTNNCGHDACRANGDIKVTLKAYSNGKYIECPDEVQSKGCSFTYAVTGSGINGNQLTFKFYSGTNPGEKIKIVASVLGHYDYMDLIPQPDHQEIRGSGSDTYVVWVPTPPIPKWTYNVPLSTSAQNNINGVPVISSVGK